MKKIIILFCIIITFNNAYSQFEKGSKWIAGSFNFSLGNSETNFTVPVKNNSFAVGFRPSLNYFKSDKVINSYFLGYSIGSSKTEQQSININKDLNQGFSLGFGKSYLSPLFNKIYSTINTNYFLSYQYSKNESSNYSPVYKQTHIQNTYGLNFNIGLGLIYRVNNRFAVSTSINNLLYGSLYSQNRKLNSTGNPEQTTKAVGLDGGFGLSGFNFGNLQFGLMYKLK